jgi:hypothetical protein
MNDGGGSEIIKHDGICVDDVQTFERGKRRAKEEN